MNSEKLLRQVIREKIRAQLTEQRKNEQALRSVIRRLIQEGDLSDIHPHRSTGINALEDVLKKSVPTLRTDFKRLTTDKSQRDSFRAHIVKAVKCGGIIANTSAMARASVSSFKDKEDS